MPAAVEDLARLREKQARSKRELAASETALAAAEQETEKKKICSFGEADARTIEGTSPLGNCWNGSLRPSHDTHKFLQRQRDSAEELKTCHKHT